MVHYEPAPVTPTPRVEATLARAAQIARARGHGYLGTEHLLLALLDDPDGIAGQVLNREPWAASIRQALEAILTSPEYQTPTRRMVMRPDTRTHTEEDL